MAGERYTIHDWRWCASILSDPAWPAPRLPLLDTVIVANGKPAFWLALDKAGAVNSKPLTGVSGAASEVYNSYCSFSLGYGRNKSIGNKSCVAHYAVGNPQVLDRAAFATQITVGFIVATCIQPYAVPQACSRLPTNIRFEYIATNDPALRDPSLPPIPVFRYVEIENPAPGDPSYRMLPGIVLGPDGKAPPGAPRTGAPLPGELVQRMQAVVEQTVFYVQRAVPKERVVKLVAEFTVDDDGNLWLVYVPEVRTEYNPYLLPPLSAQEIAGKQDNSRGTALSAIGSSAMHEKDNPTVTLPDGRVIAQHRISVPDIPVVSAKELTELRGASNPPQALQAVGCTLVQLVTGVPRNFKASVNVLRGSGVDEMLMSMKAIERTPWLVPLERLSTLRAVICSELFAQQSLAHIGNLGERIGNWIIGICQAALEYHGCPGYYAFHILQASMAESSAAAGHRAKLMAIGNKLQPRPKAVEEEPVPAPVVQKKAAVQKNALGPDHPLAQTRAATRTSRSSVASSSQGSKKPGKTAAEPTFPVRMAVNTDATADTYIATAGGGATNSTMGMGLGPRHAASAGSPSGPYQIAESGTFVCADGVSSINWVVIGQRDLSKPALHSLIVVHDVFDSWERTAAMLAPLVQHGAHALLFNLPGQPYTQCLPAADASSTGSPQVSPGSEDGVKAVYVPTESIRGMLSGLATAAGAIPGMPTEGERSQSQRGRSTSPDNALKANRLFGAPTSSSGTRGRASSPVRLPPAALRPLDLPTLPLTHMIEQKVDPEYESTHGQIGDADPAVRAERAKRILPDGSYKLPPTQGTSVPGKKVLAPPVADPNVLNNEFHAACVEQLLMYLEGMKLFRTTTASWGFDVVGLGLGGPAALTWAARFGNRYNRRGKAEKNYIPRDKAGREADKTLQGLRALTLFNCPAWLDPQLQTILESSCAILSSFDPFKTDLPITYFSRFIFSDRYLSAIPRAQAIQIYASSPGTYDVPLPGRIALVNGLLASTDMRPLLPGLTIPLVVVQSSSNGLVPARAAVDLVRARSRNAPATGPNGYPTLVEIDADPFLSPIALTKPDMGLSRNPLGGTESGSAFRRAGLTDPQSIPLPPQPPGAAFYDTLLAPEAVLRLVAALGAPGNAPMDTLLLRLNAGHEVRQERPTAFLDIIRTLIDTDGVLNTVKVAAPDGPGGEVQGEGQSPREGEADDDDGYDETGEGRWQGDAGGTTRFYDGGGGGGGGGVQDQVYTDSQGNGNADGVGQAPVSTRSSPLTGRQRGKVGGSSARQAQGLIRDFLQHALQRLPAPVLSPEISAAVAEARAGRKPRRKSKAVMHAARLQQPVESGAIVHTDGTISYPLGKGPVPQRRDSAASFSAKRRSSPGPSSPLPVPQEGGQEGTGKGGATPKAGTPRLGRHFPEEDDEKAEGESMEEENDPEDIAGVREYWAQVPDSAPMVRGSLVERYNQPLPPDPEEVAKAEAAAKLAADMHEQERLQHEASTLDKLQAAQEARRLGWDGESKEVLKTIMAAAAARRTLREKEAKQIRAFGAEQALISSTKVARAWNEAQEVAGTVVLPSLPLGPLRHDALEFADMLMAGQDEPGGVTTVDTVTTLTKEEYDEIADIPFAILRAQAQAVGEAEDAMANAIDAELELLKLGCTIKLQSWWRGRLAVLLRRKLHYAHMLTSSQEKAAIRMQRSYRANRRVFREMRYRREQKLAWQMHHGATSVQKVFRGYLVRVSMRAAKQDKSARSIQRVYRGYRDRMLTKLVRAARAGVTRYRIAATRIQAIWRMLKCRRDYYELRIVALAANQVQRWFRGHRARKEYRRLQALSYMPLGSEKVAAGMEHLLSLHGVLFKSRDIVDKLRRALYRTEDEIASAKSKRIKLQSKLSLLDEKLGELQLSEGALKSMMHEHAQGGVDRAYSRSGKRHAGPPLEGPAAKLLEATARSLSRQGEDQATARSRRRSVEAAKQRARMDALTRNVAQKKMKPWDKKSPSPDRKHAAVADGKRGDVRGKAGNEAPSGVHVMTYDGSNLKSSKLNQTAHNAKHTGPRIDGEEIRRMAYGIGCNLPAGLASIVRGQDIGLGRSKSQYQKDFEAVKAEVDFEAELALRAAYAARGKKATELLSERGRVELEIEHVKTRIVALQAQAQGIAAALKRNDRGFSELKTNIEALSTEQMKLAKAAEPIIPAPKPTAAQIAALDYKVRSIQAVSDRWSNQLTQAASWQESFMAQVLPEFVAGAGMMSVARKLNNDALMDAVGHEEAVIEELLGPMAPSSPDKKSKLGGLLADGMSTNTRMDLHTATRHTMIMQAVEENTIVPVNGVSFGDDATDPMASLYSDMPGGASTASLRGLEKIPGPGSVGGRTAMESRPNTSMASLNSLTTAKLSANVAPVSNRDARNLNNITALMARTGLLPQDLVDAGPTKPTIVATLSGGETKLQFETTIGGVTRKIPPGLVENKSHVVVAGTLIPVHAGSTQVHRRPRRLSFVDPATEPVGAAIPLHPKSALMVVDNKVRTAGMVTQLSMNTALRIATATDAAVFKVENRPETPAEDMDDGVSDVTGVLRSSSVAGSGARAARRRKSAAGVEAEEPLEGEGDRNAAQSNKRSSYSSTLYAFETDAAFAGTKKGQFELEAEEALKEATEVRLLIDEKGGLPRKLRDWSTEDVGLWLRALGLGKYVEGFSEAGVDGEFLPGILARDFRDTFGIQDRTHLSTVLSGREMLRVADLRNDCNIALVQGELNKAMSAAGGSVGKAAQELATLEDVKVPALSALMAMARAGRTRKLEVFLRAGFNPDAEDEQGNTMLIVAAAHGHKRIVDLLLSRGADINHVNALGNSCLHYVCDPVRKQEIDAEGNLEAYLLSRGADKYSRNNSNAAPGGAFKEADIRGDWVLNPPV